MTDEEKMKPTIVHKINIIHTPDIVVSIYGEVKSEIPLITSDFFVFSSCHPVIMGISDRNKAIKQGFDLCVSFLEEELEDISQRSLSRGLSEKEKQTYTRIRQTLKEVKDNYLLGSKLTLC